MLGETCLQTVIISVISFGDGSDAEIRNYHYLNDTFWFCIIERVTRVDWFFSVICHNEEWDGKLGTLY